MTQSCSSLLVSPSVNKVRDPYQLYPSPRQDKNWPTLFSDSVCHKRKALSVSKASNRADLRAIARPRNDHSLDPVCLAAWLYCTMSSSTVRVHFSYSFLAVHLVCKRRSSMPLKRQTAGAPLCETANMAPGLRCMASCIPVSNEKLIVQETLQKS